MDNTNAKTSKMPKWLKITLYTFGFLIIAVLLAMSISQIFGVRYMCILSPSMTPEIPVNSLVITVPKKFNEINVGDDISFKINDSIVTHRVIEKDNKSRTFVTKGLANENADGRTNYSDVVGVVQKTIPNIGKILVPFSSLTTKIVMLGSIIVLIVAISVIEKLIEKRKNTFSIELT